jgi:hypothetical protein
MAFFNIWTDIFTPVWSRLNDDDSTVVNFAWELENIFAFWELEDSSGVWLLEEAP